LVVVLRVDVDVDLGEVARLAALVRRLSEPYDSTSEGIPDLECADNDVPPRRQAIR
jgi:hypothetical protein